MVSGANLLPFSPAAVVARQAVAIQPLNAMNTPPAVRDDMVSYLGMDLRMFGATQPTWLAWLIMAAYGAAAFCLTVALASRLRRHAGKA